VTATRARVAPAPGCTRFAGMHCATATRVPCLAKTLHVRECKKQGMLCMIDHDGSSIHGGGLGWVGVHFSIQADAASRRGLNQVLG
jgi:hypothetical protein